MSEGGIWNIDLKHIADRYGTPIYVINLEIVKRNYQMLSRCIKDAYSNFRMFYAVKANPLIRLLKLIRGLGGGAEISSLGELEACRMAGFRGRDILFNGPGKTEQELREALDYGVLSINAESLGELSATEAIAVNMGTVARIGFRVNPGSRPKTHRYLAVGIRGGKFGFDRESFRVAINKAKNSKGLAPVGVQMHVGSQLSRVSDFKMAYTELLKFVAEFELALNHPPEFVDVGGGIGLDYERGELAISPQMISKMLSHLVGSSKWPNGAKLFLEPGRAIVGNAGILLTRVLYVKKSGKTNWALVDAGMNAFMRTALYGDRHRIIKVYGKGGNRISFAIGGPICESGDVFGEYELPHLRMGDLLAILDVGAYGSSMANNYNGHPRPPTVVLESGRVELAERRETPEDMWRRQFVKGQDF